MQKTLCFTVNDGHTFEGQLAGVNCRFLAGRHYSIPDIRKAAEFTAAVRAKIEGGEFTEITDLNEAATKIDEQTKADKARKLQRTAARNAALKEQGVALVPPGASVTVTVETGPAPDDGD